MREDFPVSNDGISAAFEFISRAVQSLGAGESIAHRMSIIVDELCANMIRHDKTLSPEMRFEIEIQFTAPRAELTISDPGQPFNPLSHVMDEQPEIGGHGIALVKGLAHALTYQRAGDRNVLSISIDGSD
ncbi:MAG: ATP-binding protein [Pseudomonadota bacterium]